ncbi:MAG TPA: 2-dehydro-3-deoxygalactonokinase [Rhodanobacteraceae bacterium]|nr:2-dehydro-3-deoxygalactonokinase [Rhodanobacteraceae bacterium]
MGGLIGLDWGASTLRAYKFDETGRIEETRSRSWGIRRLPEGGFAAALAGITEGWPTTLARLACGMVGSRGGWREIPYVDLPADATKVVNGITRVQLDNGTALHFVPGLRDPSGPDLMRGEETQLIGAIPLHTDIAGNSTWILPGTHSKWASVRDGSVTGFHTFMTGELFALLSEHSILAQGETAPHDQESFARGVSAARDSGAAGALSRLFSARALMLEGRLPPAATADYLSGLLIGEEFRAALAGHLAAPGATLQLIGEPALCERYRHAAALFEIDLAPPLRDAAAHGLWKLAEEAGLLRTTVEAPRPC